MITLFIVEDHALIRESIKQLLTRYADITIIGECDSGTIAWRKIKQYQPHVVLLDITLPGMNGFTLLRRLHLSQPHIHCIILSTHQKSTWATRALQCGARGYLTKTAQGEEIYGAICQAMQGKRYITPSVATDLATQALSIESEHRYNWHLLSDREFEIAIQLAQGYNVHDIAEQVGLSVKTITSHRSRLLKKLNISNDVQLAHLAQEAHLLDETYC